jgi:adenylosuccinate lyase
MRKMASLASGWRVDTARMQVNLDASFGLVFSQPVLLALVAAGMGRDDAYRIVQRNAMRAWSEQVSFRGLLEGDPEVTVPAEVLDEAFSLRRALRNTGAVFEALEPLR